MLISERKLCDYLSLLVACCFLSLSLPFRLFAVFVIMRKKWAIISYRHRLLDRQFAYPKVHSHPVFMDSVSSINLLICSTKGIEMKKKHIKIEQQQTQKTTTRTKNWLPSIQINGDDDYIIRLDIISWKTCFFLLSNNFHILNIIIIQSNQW